MKKVSRKLMSQICERELFGNLTKWHSDYVVSNFTAIKLSETMKGMTFIDSPI